MPMATDFKEDSGLTKLAIKQINVWKSADVTSSLKPTAREGHCSCVVGSDVYIFGGVSIGPEDDIHERGDLWKFNLDSRQWTLVQPSADSEKPLSRSAATMASVGKKLYLFGGLNHSVGWLDDFFVFDTETLRWTEDDESEGEAPSPRDKLSSAVIGDNIWFFGGFGPVKRGPLDLHDDEDEVNDSEDELEQLEAAQEAAQFGWFDDLYVYSTKERSWAQPMQMSLGKPSPRCAASMIAHKNQLVIFGGRDAEGRTNDTHIFDTVTKKWLKSIKYSGDPPAERSFHAACLVQDNMMVVIGGRGGDNQHFSDVHILDLNTYEWRTHPTTGLAARGCHTLDAVGNNAVIFGGSSDFNTALQHCNKYHGEIVISLIDADSAQDCSPSKVAKLE